MHQIATGDAVVALHGGEPQGVAGFAERAALDQPGVRGAAQRVGVEADLDAEAAVAPAKAERQGNAVGRLARQDEHRRAQLATLRRDQHHILVGEAEPLGGRRCDQRRIVPGQAGEAARHLQ